MIKIRFPLVFIPSTSVWFCIWRKSYIYWHDWFDAVAFWRSAWGCTARGPTRGSSCMSERVKYTSQIYFCIGPRKILKPLLLSVKKLQPQCLITNNSLLFANRADKLSETFKSRKRYVVKHNLITEVYLMTMWWKQLHVSACIGHHQVV